nr:hypothetical protein [Desulfobacterales bacterium]
MSRLENKLERIFAATAFAEAWDHASAMQIAGICPNAKKRGLDGIFAAVTFAEAGCPEIAQEFLGKSPSPWTPRRENPFLARGGVQGIRVWYGVARI